MNPIFEAYRQSDLFGKLIFISLFGLSVLTWTIWIKKWLFFKEMKRNAHLIQKNFEKKRHQPLSQDFTIKSHPFTDVYLAIKAQTVELLNKNKQASPEGKGITLSRSDIELIDGSLGGTISGGLRGMDKNLFLLSTVVSLAPFLGLLGTVWGILVTFTHLQNGAGPGAHAMVMNGLAMALGTTVVGLLVAIPALIAYNSLKTATQHFHSDVEDFSQLLLSSIEVHYRKVEN